MENNKQHCFTAFRNKSSKQAQVCTLNQVMNAIIGGTWKKEIQEIRDLLAAGEKEKAAEKKAALVYVTYSGIFEGGHKATQLKEYSQYLVADFDEVDPRRVDEYLQKMKEIPWLESAFATPSMGLKAIVLVELVEEYLGKHFVLRRNIVLGQLEFLRLGDREENWCPMTDYEENPILRDLLLNNFKK